MFDVNVLNKILCLYGMNKFGEYYIKWRKFIRKVMKCDFLYKFRIGKLGVRGGCIGLKFFVDGGYILKCMFGEGR